jgi:hypothetical protein
MEAITDSLVDILLIIFLIIAATLLLVKKIVIETSRNVRRNAPRVKIRTNKK